jgi:glycine dehydrogenase subunit 1
MRYLPLTDDDRREMLGVIGAASVPDLFVDVPAEALLAEPVDLPHAKSEMEVERTLTRLAAKNVAAGSVPSFLGAGAYRHHVPASVDYLIQRGEFLTAYTPYQPEIAQGTLQALFEFQTQVALLTGMDVANASMYDGATSAAEATLMANRVTKRSKIIASGNLHPHYAASIDTLARQTGFTYDAAPPSADASDVASMAGRIDGKTSAVIVQYPDAVGHIVDLTDLAAAAHAAGALMIVVTTEIVALGALKPPGTMGADIVAAEGQSIGNSLNYGGPHVGLFACTQKLVRQMPGRLCGETVDAEGKRGFVLTLSTREQHIRRAKATSNICTNAGLCALAFTIHMTLLGETGLTELAAHNHARASQTADRLAAIPGVELLTSSFFNEFALRLSKPAAGVVEAMAAAGVLGGVPASRLWPGALDDVLLVAATETNTDDDVAALAAALKEACA